jgi:citrate lyase subunit beta/citryl-CoA lyase
VPSHRADAPPTDVTVRWRSPLFVPGNHPELIAKAVRTGADAIVLDLEDAVPPAQKADARAAVVEAIAAIAGHGSVAVEVCVRVNPPGTPWFADDVAALPAGVASVVVPKWESMVDIDHPVVAGLETVRGVVDAGELLGGPVVACYFGAEDYVADLGGIRTGGNAEVATARSLVGMAARLAGVAAIDMITVDFHDHDRFRREAEEARALGYSGKLCIHPGQVELANEAFVPSDEEVAWADRVLAAFAAAEGETIGFEGQMVDEVVAARARAILAARPPS